MKKKVFFLVKNKKEAKKQALKILTTFKELDFALWKNTTKNVEEKKILSFFLNVIFYLLWKKTKISTRCLRHFALAKEKQCAFVAKDNGRIISPDSLLLFFPLTNLKIPPSYFNATDYLFLFLISALQPRLLITSPLTYTIITPPHTPLILYVNDFKSTWM